MRLRPVRIGLRRLALVAGAVLAVTSVPVDGVAGAVDDPAAWSVYRYNDRVVRWNRCQAIGYRVNLAGAPQGARSQLREAFDRVEYRSGLRFRYQGTTRVFPALRTRYPSDTRLVIGWTTPGKSREMPGGVLGVGGFQYVGVRDGRRVVGIINKGFVQFNSNFNDDLPDGFGRGRRVGLLGTKGQIMMHEIGHAVGLKHVNNKPQIMYPSTTYKYARFGRGDANGLERVGSAQRCVAAPAPNATTAGTVTTRQTVVN